MTTRPAVADGEHGTVRRHLRRWGAAWLLVVLFLTSWAAQLIAQLAAGDDLTDFAAATAENWQSEWLQLLVQAVLLLALKHQLFKADAEDQERLERKVDALLAQRGSRLASTFPPPTPTTPPQARQAGTYPEVAMTNPRIDPRNPDAPAEGEPVAPEYPEPAPAPAPDYPEPGPGDEDGAT
jgi:hypothetical protein